MSLFLAIKKSVMEASRRKKLQQFYALCKHESKILDVGVSSIEHNEQVNLFLHNFRFRDEFYTGLAVEKVDALRARYPAKKFVEYPGGLFPFQQQEFEWSFSNAVVEHVGRLEDQITFINEMLRVSNNVFFTTPNKYFPVESHTNVFFIHWLTPLFYWWCRKNHTSWSRDNLNLFSFKDIDLLMVKTNAKKYKILKNKFAGLTMTFTVICH